MFAGDVAVVVNLGILTAQDTGLGLDILIGIENLTGGTAADRLLAMAAQTASKAMRAMTRCWAGAGRTNSTAAPATTV